MPKTLRNEYNKYLTYENLMEAHRKSQNGKTTRKNIVKFNLKQEEYIMWLYEKLKTKTYKHGGYNSFYVTEPKLRKVEASAYIDRVVHRWCVDSFLERAFAPQFIDTSFACIKGKGMHKAALAVQDGMRKCKKQYGEYYILKMDIAKYFASIHKEKLVEILERKIADKDVLWLLNEIIYSKPDKTGIPIGNLTSQIFANIYYNEADQYIKHVLKVKYYYRYMDDSVILMQNKEEIKHVKEKIQNFIENELYLTFNSKTNIFKSKQGVNFCGYKINEYRMKLRSKGKKKIKRTIKKLKLKIKNGEMSSKDAKKHLCGHFGYMKYANTYNFINLYFETEEKNWGKSGT